MLSSETRSVTSKVTTTIIIVIWIDRKLGQQKADCLEIVTVGCKTGYHFHFFIYVPECLEEKPITGMLQIPRLPFKS